MARKTSKRASRHSIADLAAALDAIAPFRLAADWDNVGLLAGQADWPLENVLIALDLTDAVADEAISGATDAIVTYHPPIFKALKAITDRSPGPTSRLPALLARRIALLSTHTALDAVPGGTNDLLLDAFDTVSRAPLTVEPRAAGYKLVVFAPADEISALRSALSAAGAGVIGAYGECGFAIDGRGSFRGGATSHPTIGERGQLEHVDETRFETVVPADQIGEVVRALYANHSYEEPAFDLYPLHGVADRGGAGMGRVGVLRKPTAGTALIKSLGGIVDLAAAQVVGDLRRRFTRVVTAAGAFGVDKFADRSALYVTGEFKHHDALTLTRRGVTAVQLGHYASERPTLDFLRRRLAEALPAARARIARGDRAPLRPLQSGGAK